VGRSITSTARQKIIGNARQDEKKELEGSICPPKSDSGACIWPDQNGGFRGFGLRGLAKVKGEFALNCMAFNTKKIVKACRTGKVRLKSGNNPKFG